MSFNSQSTLKLKDEIEKTIIKRSKKPHQIWITCQKTNPNKSNIEG
jgi:hypothetical protein